MSTLTPSLAGPLIDPQAFNEVAAQMPAKVALLVEYFVADATDQLAAITNALHGPAETAAPIVGGLAHQLKSSARQLGAIGLSQTARELEAACRRTPPAGQLELQDLQQQLQNALSPTVAALNQLAASYRNPG